MINIKDSTRARRTFLKTAVATSTLAALPFVNSDIAKAATSLDQSMVIEEGGFYTQDWFLESFLDLSEDLSETAHENKRFAIIWEQKGCPYCRDTHLINFSTPVIRDWIKKRFNFVQLDIWGLRKVTYFDGTVMEERELARKLRVSFTPTIQFFPPLGRETIGKSGFETEVMRMPGYFRRFHFITMFEYIHEKAYERVDFQRYLVDKVQRYKVSGKTLETWKFQ